MKEVVFLCNTYYQLIVAVQLRLTQFRKDKAYLILTDHSKNAKGVAKRAASAECFDNVYYINVKSLDKDKHNIKDATGAISAGVSGNVKGLSDIDKLRCDEFIYYNLCISTVIIFGKLNKLNKSLKCSRMEEGILSYGMKFHDGDEKLPVRIRAIFKIRKFLGRKNLPECVRDFYCFYPGMYHGKLNPVKISEVSLSLEIKDILAKVFNLSFEDNEYQEKYIFFTSVGDFEGDTPIGEINIVKKVAKLVGKNNLLIKQHPRDNRDVFQKEGFHVDHNSAVPWEAIQLSKDFREKVLLSINSTSILSSVLMIENGPKVAYLYPLCDFWRNEQVKKNVENLQVLLDEQDILESEKITIINKLEEIQNV